MITWQINKQILVLSLDDGSVYTPLASDIYAIVFKGATGLLSKPGMLIPVLNDQLPFLKFSKFGLPIKVRISYTADNEITITFYAIVKDSIEEIAVTGSSTADHIIINNTWYHVTRDIDTVVKLMADSKISQSGSISLRQYLNLKKICQSDVIIDIEDNLQETLKKKESTLYSQIAESFIGTLYPYQQKGYEWLRYTVDEECGCILGDEMGLGKTIQIIALLAWRSSIGRNPSLVIAPVSLIENWKREIGKFAPSLKLLIHRGTDRTGFYTKFKQYDVILSSYDTVVNDLSIMKMMGWDLLILDEAQNIKNPYALRTKALKKIPKQCGIAVTGTPFENHMSDIWSITDFVLPNYLGTLSEYELKIPDEIQGARIIEPLVSPILLRRLVSEVATDLPERIEIPQVIEMSSGEANKYEELRSSAKYSKSKAAGLALLQKLRMFCTHPFLLEHGFGDPIQDSSKYNRLCEIVEEIVSYGDKFIIFTSYNHMNSILIDDLSKRFAIPGFTITGSTPPEERQLLVDRFSSISGSALMVLNPRAAGVGLNITAANHVIHYNLEWNPALEDQASARAYRRGQTKIVTVHRLFYAETVEEIVNERIIKKRDLSETAIIGNEGSDYDAADIIRAINITPFRR